MPVEFSEGGYAFMTERSQNALELELVDVDNLGFVPEHFRR